MLQRYNGSEKLVFGLDIGTTTSEPSVAYNIMSSLHRSGGLEGTPAQWRSPKCHARWQMAWTS